MASAIRVFKFGGASLATLGKIGVAAARVAKARAAGDRIVVVVSAMEGETDRLLALGRTVYSGRAELSSVPELRSAELDVLAATGEQTAAALFALRLNALDLKARSFLGHELPIRTDSNHGDAAILGVARGRIDSAFESDEIPVIAGFQGISPEGRITTLGRGGSDTTAVAVAVALGATECVFHKDVDGIHSLDPRLGSGSPRFHRIAYRHMLALSQSGAKVLHASCVSLAMRYRVPLLVTSGESASGGTQVIPDSRVGIRAGAIAVAVRDGAVSLIGDFPSLARPHLTEKARSRLESVGIAARVSETADTRLTFETAPELAARAARELHESFCLPAAAPKPIAAFLAENLAF